MTYSIVARDTTTGQLGIAAQSHAFAVGRVLHHIKPGVGAVASQAMSLYAHGDRIMASLPDRATAADALAASLAMDEEAAQRQVTVITATGDSAAHTGAQCLRFAGHHRGTDYVLAGNILSDEGVLAAMISAAEHGWRATVPGGDEPPSVARRMMAVLEAGEAAGGDLRGRQSATMVVVTNASTGEPLLDRLVDIRVDDSTAPLVELARLLDLAEAHTAMEVAEHALVAGDLDTARSTYTATLPRMGDNLEFHLWAAVSMAEAGQFEDASELAARLKAAENRARWEELSHRLVERGMISREIVEGWWQ